MDNTEQTIQTYDLIAPDYCKKTRQQKYLDWEEVYVRKLLSYVSITRPLILDVGCGDGRHTVIIERSGGRAIGADLSSSMLAEARLLYPSGDFRQMDMRRLLFEDGTLDGIWSSGSIYHVSKAEVSDVISEFGRVLKPQGVVAINFKIGAGEGMEANPKSYSGSPRYFAYYSVQEMTGLFKDAGFVDLDSCLFPEEIYGDNVQEIWFRKGPEYAGK